jgi:hypothetical protein
MGGTMPRQNYSMIVCFILLAVAVLVRTAAIAQRAYDVLLPPMSGEEPVPAITTVTTGRTAEPSLTVNAHPIVASVGGASVEHSPPNVAVETIPDVGSSAKGNVSPAYAGKAAQKITRARRHYAARYSYRSDRTFWPMWR